jgi:hypothetical protein
MLIDPPNPDGVRVSIGVEGFLAPTTNKVCSLRLGLERFAPTLSTAESDCYALSPAQ